MPHPTTTMRTRMATAALLGALPALLISSAAQAQTQFTDVTNAAGLTYDHHSLAPINQMQPYMAGGAAAGDVNGDGHVDLYVTRLDDSDILYLNNGNGTFTDATNTWFGAGHLSSVQTNGVAFADIDNDNDLDLYVTSINSSRYHLYINNGSSFSEDAITRGVALNTADTKYGYSPGFGDYNKDGLIDLATTEWRLDPQNPGNALQNNRLFMNDPNNPGHFIDVTQSAGVATDAVVPVTPRTFDSQGFSPRFADIDQDGNVDYLLAGDHSTSRLFWGNGDGTFTDGTVLAGVGTDQFGMGSAIGDIDNDGDFDWFVTSIYQENNPTRNGNRLYEYFGFRIFLDSTDTAGVRDGQWGWAAAFLDADLDGDLDLIQTNGADFPTSPASNISAGYENDQSIYWENDGTGVFAEVSNAVGVTDNLSGKGLLTFDYDNDGDLDVFIVNNGDAPTLYRNDTVTDNDYLIVRTTGTSDQDNLHGVGALVRVILDETKPNEAMIRQVQAGSHFLGQSEVMAHFGLGDVTNIDMIEIEWLDGTTDTYHDVSPNSVLNAIQVSGLALGDLNGDGAVTNGDIAAFVQALTDLDGYNAAFPQLDADTLGDFDGNGQLTNGDIAGFIATLTGGGSGVPEPTSLVLLGLSGLLACRRRR